MRAIRGIRTNGLWITLVVFAMVIALFAQLEMSGQQAKADVPAGVVGVNAVTLRLGVDDEKELDLIDHEGFNAIRLHVEWPVVEPAPGQFDWAETDRQIIEAAKRQLQILAVVTYTPSWAAVAVGPNYLHPRPADPAQFGAFVKIAAERYRGMVRSWEIWNEPNVVQSFAPAPDPGVYSRLLQNAYTAIKSTDPQSTVITGGTSPSATSDTGIAPAAFMQAIYDNGAGDYFDAVAMHPYSAPNLLSAPGPPESSNAAIAAVTEVLRSHGQGDKPIWFTEFGASTAGQSAGDLGQVGVTEQRQAEILVDAIRYLRTLANCGPLFIFDHRDIDSASNNVEFRYGLLRSDFSPKPALPAVQQLLGGT